VLHARGLQGLDDHFGDGLAYESSSKTSEKFSQRVSQSGQMLLDNQPHAGMIYLCISMYEDITEGDDPRQIGNELSSAFIHACQTGKRFADNFDCRSTADLRTMSPTSCSKVLPDVMAAIASAASLASQSKTLGSRLKQGHP
jgi:hypothetical protein